MMPTAVNVAAGVKPSTSVSSSIFSEKVPVPSVTVTKASIDCGVAGIVPLAIETFVIATNCPSNDSGLLVIAAIVAVTGVGAGPADTIAMPYGDVVFSTLLRRFPEARLLDDQPAYAGSAMLRAIQSLPTDLGPPA